jgi:hypothetical protein
MIDYQIFSLALILAVNCKTGCEMDAMNNFLQITALLILNPFLRFLIK